MSGIQFTFPAEFEKHTATWLAWPHHSADWPGKFFAIKWVFLEIIKFFWFKELL
jgi:agmatine deiminase